MTKKTPVFIIDTSAILSGKPMTMDEGTLMTTPGVAAEFTPGGRDYQIFQLLREKGLQVQMPSTSSVTMVVKTAGETGDKQRLSPADVEILALAVDINLSPDKEAVIVTDDYSIQNVAAAMDIQFLPYMQKGITKKFKWQYQCPGCKQRFPDMVKTCPICGTATRLIPYRKTDVQ